MKDTVSQSNSAATKTDELVSSMPRHAATALGNIDPARLLYRNQFVLGPQYVDWLPTWQRVEIDRSVRLTVHPDLYCYHASNGRKSVTLLGFILDPDDETADNDVIVDELLERLKDCDSFIAQTYRFGGRWILIACDGKRTIAFNDPAGLRQVFYTRREYLSELWCASQPGILARLLGLEMDPEALGMIDSYTFRHNQEYWWPGNGSPFKEIAHLPPNRSLDLKTRHVHRYWPDADLRERSVDEVLEAICSTLTGMLRSGARRFDLTQAVTAGMDSRLFLAASREVAERISYMTIRQLSMKESHADLQIPAVLLSELGLAHHIVRSTVVTDPEFIRLFKMNTPLSHDQYAPDAQAILNYFRLTKVCVVGAASEIVRDPTIIANSSIRGKITPVEISRDHCNISDHPYAVREIEKWITELGDTRNVDLDTILYWELREGNWRAMNQVEFDIAWKDILVPNNCRRLLADMLSVRERDRKIPDDVLYKKLIAEMWPEVMCQPINPHKLELPLRRLVTTVKTRGKNLIRGSPLLNKWFGYDE
jgi:hypothetical protein